MDESSLLFDYIVFVLLIMVSVSVAIYSKFSGPVERTKADYVFAASSSVSMGYMMLSIARGFLGVRVFLGYPSELFYRGSAMWETLYGMIIAFPLVCFFFVPVYFSLGITSVYQYLDLRFKSRLVRCLASGTYVFRSLLNLGVTVFTPCVALKTVIGLPYWFSIMSIVAVSIIFTLLGGLRTAIIADVVQLLVMIGCSVVIIFQGVISAGGVVNVVETSYDGGRLDFFNFNLDPTIRVTTVSAIIGQLFMSLSIFGCQQNFVQRYCSMESQSKVTKTLMFNIPVMTVLFSISWIVGMVIYANYANCDPKRLGYISDIDEILPFYVEDKFYFLPGFLGLVMASLFNGALSLMVSNLNSLATVLWEDFVSQIPSMKGLSDRKQVLIIKFLGSICGVLIMGIAFIVAHLSGVIESSMLMTSATSGPLLGVFLLAFFFPFVNWKGAASGMIVSHCVVLWITVASQLLVDKPEVPLLPTETYGCTNTTFSAHVGKRPIPVNASWMVTTIQDEYFTDLDPAVAPAAHDADFLTSLYSITYMYYSLMGTVITVVVGIIVSIITISKDDQFDESLLHPIAYKLSRLISGKKRCAVSPQQSATNNVSTLPTISDIVTEKYKTTKNGSV